MKISRYAFHELNLHRVQLTVSSYNEGAISLYERLGFRREGTYREYLRRDGRRLPHVSVRFITPGVGSEA